MAKKNAKKRKKQSAVRDSQDGSSVASPEVAELEDQPSRWKLAFGIDVRSLALFRVAAAALILIDLYIRAHDVKAFYSDAGVLPRSLLFDFYSNTKFFGACVHVLSGSVWWQYALFVVAAFFGFMLLVGYRTRLATIVSWVLLVSLQNRNPMVLQAGDVLLRTLLFWSIFLPLGARFSVDAGLDKSENKSPRLLCNPASIALLLQMWFIYFFTFLLKDGASWGDGTALYYALHIDQLTKPLGAWMRQYSVLTTFSTHATVWLEGIGPFLPFIPFYNGRFRIVAILLFTALHMGITLTMDVGLFSYISIIGWLPYVPKSFWDSIASRSVLGRGTTIFFSDGHDGTDKKTAGILKSFLALPHAQLLPTQTEPDVLKAATESKSIAVRDASGGLHFGSEAIGLLCSQSAIAWPIARIVNFKPLAWLYGIVASALRQFIAALKTRNMQWGTHWAVQGFVAFCLAYVLAWNVRTVDFDYFVKYFPREWNQFGRVTALAQHWSMFSPNPAKVDGWFIVAAMLEDGSQIDLYNNGQPLDWSRPDQIYRQHTNQRWRKYMMNLKEKKNRPHREPMSDYFCESWSERHPENPALRVGFGFAREVTPPPGEAPDRPEKKHLFDYVRGSYKR